MHEFFDWPALSRDAALAWQLRENMKCRCGQVPVEWRKFDDEGRPVLDASGRHVEDRLNPPAHVEGEFCPACAALDRAQKAAPKTDKGNPNPGWVLRFVPNPGHVPAWDKALGSATGAPGPT